MLRTALRPRWTALLVLALVLATGMAALGQWQLDRARQNGRRQAVQAAAHRPAVALTSLLAPRRTFTNADADRPVTARGRWDGAHQVLVAERYLDGERGWWVLTPLVLDGGGAVAVVRGWVPSPTDAAASTERLPAVAVDVGGVLRPPEPPVDREPGAGSGLPEGQLDGVDLTQLVQRWPQKLYVGYVVLTAQRPAPDGAGPRPVPPTAPSNQALAWQNLSYAGQWFVFAGFLLVLWFRLVRDDHRSRSPAAAPPTGRGDNASGTTDESPAEVPAGTPTEIPTDTLTERGAQP